MSFSYKGFVPHRGTTERYRNWPYFAFLKRSDRRLFVCREYLLRGSSEAVLFLHLKSLK